MQLSFATSTGFRQAHLSYCSNIHAGESWSEVFIQLQRALPEIKRQISPDARFGIGLRLSALAARELDQPDHLAKFKAFLDQQDLYVYTLNGFPYGPFHHTPVKDNVYLPDWRDPERLNYTCLLANLLRQLLPDDISYGSISTVPGGYKAALQNEQDIAAISHHLIGAVEYLFRIEQQHGKQIQLALEPEPCCLLETIDETVAFFQQQLLSSDALMPLSQALNCHNAKAEDLLRRHLGVCLDSCHAAVEFEQPKALITALKNAGISIAKVQLSSALRIPQVQLQHRQALEQYADPVYLHQVVERQDQHYRRYADLPEALASLNNNSQQAKEWRIHFHVPIFRAQMHQFATTQDFLLELLDLYKQQPFSAHLEVETYSWTMLPLAYRQTSLYQDISRELAWVLQILRTD